jgi:hypothetical protein
LTVAAVTLVLESSTLASGIVGAPYSQSIVVTGGVAPYVYSIASGQLPAGVVLDAGTGALTGTPTAAGAYAFAIRVVDSRGATGVFPQAIVVEPRPDPTQDPTVRGLLAAQVSTSARFGMAQMDNVGARIRMLHFGQDPCAFRFDVTTNARWEQSGSPDEQARAATEAARQEPAPQEENRRCASPIAVWVGGGIDFGFLRPSTATDRSDFNTAGLTLGADTQVTERLVLGAALGYGRDKTDIGAMGDDSRAQGTSGSVYGTYAPLKSVFVDLTLGYGRLDFDSMRGQGSDLTLGGRSGSQAFGSLGVSGLLDAGALQLLPYGRYDRVSSRLGSYVESGPRSRALGFGSLNALEEMLAAGLAANYRIPIGRARLEPSVRVELRRARGSSVDQSVWYADAPTTTYWMFQDGVSDTQVLGALGLMLRVEDELSLGLEYSYTGSSGTYRSETVRAILRAPL